MTDSVNLPANFTLSFYFPPAAFKPDFSCGLAVNKFLSINMRIKVLEYKGIYLLVILSQEFES